MSEALLQGFLLTVKLVCSKFLYYKIRVGFVGVWQEPPDNKPCTSAEVFCNERNTRTRLVVFLLLCRVFGGSVVLGCGCCVVNCLVYDAALEPHRKR